jgi:hypothetical protein
LLQGKKGAAQAAPFFYADQEERLGPRKWLSRESWSRKISRKTSPKSEMLAADLSPKTIL